MQGKSPIMKKILGDLNKDGKMSSYETTRQDAIESAAKMKGPKPLTKEQRDKANKEKRKEKIVNKKPPTPVRS